MNAISLAREAKIRTGSGGIRRVDAPLVARALSRIAAYTATVHLLLLLAVERIVLLLELLLQSQ